MVEKGMLGGCERAMCHSQCPSCSYIKSISFDQNGSLRRHLDANQRAVPKSGIDQLVLEPIRDHSLVAIKGRNVLSCMGDTLVAIRQIYLVNVTAFEVLRSIAMFPSAIFVEEKMSLIDDSCGLHFHPISSEQHCRQFTDGSKKSIYAVSYRKYLSTCFERFSLHSSRDLVV